MGIKEWSRAVRLLIVAMLVLTGMWGLGTVVSPASGDERPVAHLASRCESNPVLQTVTCRPR